MQTGHDEHRPQSGPDTVPNQGKLKDLGTMSRIQNVKVSERAFRRTKLASTILALMIAMPAFAVPAMADEAAPSSNANVNLINLLVKRGVLTKEDARTLIKQANDEASAAQAARASTAATAAAAGAAAPAADGAIHVTYVPDIVKKQIREELKQEVMAQAQSEHWAAPDEMPAWTKHLRIYGDIRTRYEGIFYPSGNDPQFYNFNSINAGSPYDVSSANTNYPPLYDATKNRNRFRLRARIGLEADLGQDFTAGFRMATGDSNSPVSTNQSMGGSGGDFSKYSLWLDRSWLRYEPLKGKGLNLAATVGRFDNPFFSTDLLFDDDLGFDGVAVQTKYEVSPGVTPFVTVGAFPIYNTDLNFGSTGTPDKYSSNDKYLFGGQIGLDWKFAREYNAKIGVAFYDFDNVAGQLSNPCTVLNSSSTCDSDASRPSFAQKGNTYMYLRDIIPDANNNFGTLNQYQYFGLATPFRVLAFTGRLDFDHFNPFHIALDGEVLKNLAFDESEIGAKAVNNCGTGSTATYCGFDGGDTGYFLRATLGAQKLEHLGDWNVNIGYKHLESDATVDGFTDSDFGLGGTNLKGYIVGGNFALSDNVQSSLRWMSADSIAGSPFSVDILQLDLSARF